SGLRRGRIRSWNLSCDDARILQGADVSRRRQRDSRHASRAGHAAHGWSEPVYEVHVLDISRRLAGHLRHYSVFGLLVERRDSVAYCFDKPYSDWLVVV